MELTSLVACICEGGAEKTIMKILLDNDLLIFGWEDMLEESLLTCRNGEKFEPYLRKAFVDKISVIRILDSRRESFKVGKAYEHKIEIVNVITAPEIEILSGKRLVPDRSGIMAALIKDTLKKQPRKVRFTSEASLPGSCFDYLAVFFVPVSIRCPKYPS